MHHQIDAREVAALDVAACFELLRRCTLGRVALTEPIGPVVVPVNYVIDGDGIVFRSDDGAKLRGDRRLPISFQVDGFDPLRETGWSVLVRGVASAVSDDDVRRLHLRPWAADGTRHWVRLAPVVVTGRRIPADSSLPAEAWSDR